MSAQDISEQMLYGDETYHGNGIYGDGLYFANSLSGSKSYAGGGVGQNAYVKAFINPQKARSISYSRLQNIQRSITSSKINRGLSIAQNNASRSSRGDSDGSLPQLAVMLGYNVIDLGQGTGYKIVLDRSALTMSDKVTKF